MRPTVVVWLAARRATRRYRPARRRPAILPGARQPVRARIADMAADPALASIASRWYAANARDLPWRRAGRRWMGGAGQRDHAAADAGGEGAARLRRWLDRWPGPADLAADTPGEAIRMWGKLGYPRRALRLHECAKVIAAEHGGVVPASVDALLALPGIGDYTARAIAAFAYGQRHPWSTPTSGGCCAGLSTASTTAAAPRLPATASSPSRCCRIGPAAAARASIAFMELGALVCTAGRPAAPPARSARCAAGTPPGCRRIRVLGGRPRVTPAPTGRSVAGCSTCCERAPAR